LFQGHASDTLVLNPNSAGPTTAVLQGDGRGSAGGCLVVGASIGIAGFLEIVGNFAADTATPFHTNDPVVGGKVNSLNFGL